MTSSKRKRSTPKQSDVHAGPRKKPYSPPGFQKLNQVTARAKLEAEAARDNLGAQEMLRHLDQATKNSGRTARLGTSQMRSLLVRLQTLVIELLELNSELERDTGSPTGTEARSDLAANPSVLRAFKGLVDHSRHLIWPYVLQAEQRFGLDVHGAMQQYRMDRVRQMLGAIQRAPASEATRSFLGEVRRMADGEN